MLLLCVFLFNDSFQADFIVIQEPGPKTTVNEVVLADTISLFTIGIIVEQRDGFLGVSGGMYKVNGYIARRKLITVVYKNVGSEEFVCLLGVLSADQGFCAKKISKGSGCFSVISVPVVATNTPPACCDLYYSNPHHHPKEKKNHPKRDEGVGEGFVKLWSRSVEPSRPTRPRRVVIYIIRIRITTQKKRKTIPNGMVFLFWGG